MPVILDLYNFKGVMKMYVYVGCYAHLIGILWTGVVSSLSESRKF